MIYFFCTRRNSSPIVQYLRAIWPGGTGARIEVVHYEDIARFGGRGGLVVFSDVELLAEDQRAAAAALHARLVAEPGRFRVWNNPSRSARRMDVLDTLAAAGTNRFRAFRAGGDLPADLRYPVFVRDEHEHTGALTALLRDGKELDAALAGLRAGARKEGPLLVVEYLAYASADGYFRKYSVFRFGGRLVPKHVLFSDNWMLKVPDYERFIGADWLDEETLYLKECGERGQVEDIFDRFAVDYGRIDYAVVNGRVQVFEINTNPTLLKPSNLQPGPRLATHRWFAGHADEAWLAGDPGEGAGLWRRSAWRLHRPKLNPRSWWRRRGGFAGCGTNV